MVKFVDARDYLIHWLVWLVFHRNKPNDVIYSIGKCESIQVNWREIRQETALLESWPASNKYMHAVQRHARLSPHQYPSNQCLYLHQASKSSICPSCLFIPTLLAITLSLFKQKHWVCVTYQVTPKTSLNLHCRDFSFCWDWQALVFRCGCFVSHTGIITFIWAYCAGA